MIKRKVTKINFQPFISIFLFISCVANTGHLSTDTSKYSISSDSINYCTSSKSRAAPFANSSDGATGTSSSDPYRICTAAQFNAIGASSSYWNKYFILMSDINLSSYTANTYNKIGSVSGGVAFTGTLLGNGKQITGTTFSSASTDNVGLFAYVGAGGVIKDLTLNSFTVTGQDNVGVLIGKMSGGSVNNIVLKGSSVTGRAYVGGLIGLMQDGVVSRSSFTVTSTSTSAYVTGSGNYVGGLIGSSVSGNVLYSSTSLPGVTGVSYVGGLVGYNQGASIYSSNAETITDYGISGTNYIGGLVGYNVGQIESSYAKHGKVNGTDYIGGLVGYNQYEIKKSYTTITTTSGVTGATYVGGLVGYNLSGDIIQSYTIGTVIYGTASSVGGLIGHLIAGEVKTSYAKISNRVQAGTTYLGGLVGYAAGGTIDGSYTELNGSSGSLIGSSAIGGLIGYNNGATILNSSVKATTAFGNYSYLGGFVGRNAAGNIDDCVVDIVGIGTSAATGTYIGGVAGDITGGSILSCTVSISSAIYGGSYVGGLVGYNNSATSRIESVTLTMNGSLNAPDTAATESYLGGAVGYNIGVLENVTIDINSNIVGVSDYVGGLVGYHTGTIHRSTVEVNNITGEDYVGGVVGLSSGTITYTSGTIASNVLGENFYIGGYIGAATDGEIFSGSVTVGGNITGVSAGSYLGGFAGVLSGAAVKVTSSSTNVTGNVSMSGSSYVGGFVGESNNMLYATKNAAVIGGSVIGGQYVGGFVGALTSGLLTRSYSQVTGNITATTSIVGGFSGNVDASIEDCFTRVSGEVNSNSGAGDYAGGFSGAISATGKINNVYATATTVKGNNYLGGLVGNFSAGAELDHSFSLTNLVGVAGQVDVEYLIGSNNSNAALTGANYLYHSSNATCSPVAGACVAASASVYTYAVTPSDFTNPTDADVTSLYSTWSFTDIWTNNYGSSTYPTLQ